MNEQPPMPSELPLLELYHPWNRLTPWIDGITQKVNHNLTMEILHIDLLCNPSH
jgi:hypothetical protein